MIRILSINLRGFDTRKQNFLFDYVRSNNFDFCCVQEIMSSDHQFFTSLASRWRGPCFWSPSIGRQGSSLILISETFNNSVISWRKDFNGRIVSILVSLGSFKLNLINIYAPTNLTERKIFFEHLHESFIPADYTVIAGDFNCYERDLDKFGGYFLPVKYLSDFRSNFHFVDAFRKLHPHFRQFTWFNSDFSIASRLDKFFVSSNFVPLLQSCAISPCCFSDHDFIDLHFVLNDTLVRGPGLWKFNNSLLSDSVFYSFICDRISDL